MEIEDDEVMVSFDVTSLFTNVDKVKAMDLAREALEKDTDLHTRTRMTIQQIVDGIAVCLNMAYFTFDSKLYCQKEGLAMGSPLSPVLADIYMEDFERKALGNEAVKPRVWWRYMDDTFVIIKRDRLEAFHNFLNQLDQTIKLTMELETETKTLPFLDCLVSREGRKLKTSMYRKPSDTGAILSFTSAHPRHVFSGIASSLFHEAKQLCSEEQDKRRAIKDISDRLRQQGYPDTLIRRQLPKVPIPTGTTQRE